MPTQLFANNASALLAASIDDNDLTIQVAAGYGTLFPNPGADEYFLVTLVNASGDYEIVKCSSRTTDLITIATGGRGQEGTVAQAWTNGQTRVESRLTKGTMDGFLQRSGGALTGDLDADGNEIVDAVLSGTGTRIEGGEIVGVPIRGATGVTSNQLAVPTDGSRATAGGSAILCNGDDLSGAVFETGMIMLWFGSALSVPTGWAICNGSNGTPDLRDRFVVGAGSTYALDATGGAATLSGNSGAGGDHTHGGTTGDTAITEAQMPAHNHRVLCADNSSNSNADGWQASSNIAVAGEDVGPQNYRDTNVAGTKIIEDAGSGNGHNHSISASGTHTHSLSGVAALPPYRALYYIMKT